MKTAHRRIFESLDRTQNATSVAASETQHLKNKERDFASNPMAAWRGLRRQLRTRFGSQYDGRTEGTPRYTSNTSEQKHQVLQKVK